MLLAIALLLPCFGGLVVAMPNYCSRVFNASQDIPVKLSQIIPNFIFSHSQVYVSTYDSNMDCQWRIRGPVGSKISIRFRYIDLEACCDKVELYDGPSTASRLISFVSGQPGFSEPVYETTSNVMTVRFLTDSSVSYYGFILSYFVSTLVSASSTRIAEYLDEARSDGFEICLRSGQAERYVTDVSAGFPMLIAGSEPGVGTRGTTYASNVDCQFTFRVPAPAVLKVMILQAELEPQYDFLTVYDNSTVMARVSTRTGAYPTEWMYTRGNSLNVQFTSDGSVSFAGFRVAVLYQNTLVCSGNFEAPIDGTTFRILSHDTAGTSAYAISQNCISSITAPQGYRIGAFFTYASFETCCDGVILFDGSSSGPRIVTLQVNFGSYVSPTYFSTSNKMTVNFFTDNSFNNNGFLLFVYAEKLNALALTCSQSGISYSLAAYSTGSVVSHSGFADRSSLYTPGITCSWTLNAPAGYYFSIWLMHLDLDSQDWIEFVDPPSSSSIAKISPINLISSKILVSKSNSLTIIFDTRYNIAPARGFYLTFDVVPDGRTCLAYSWNSYETSANSLTIDPSDPPVSLMSQPRLSAGTVYPAEYSCGWQVLVYDSLTLMITFNYLELEPNFDSLLISNGVSNIVANLSSGVGQYPTPLVFYSTGLTSITFSSDVFIEKSGFRLTVQATGSVCGSATGNVAVSLNSRGYIPSHVGKSQHRAYFNNMLCTWTLIGPAGKVVVAQVMQYELEACCDAVDFFYPNGSLIGSLTGSGDASVEFSSGFNTMTVQFRTNPTKTYSGFTLVHWAVEPTDCHLPWNLVDGPGNNPTGEILSHKGFHFGFNYKNNANCDWTLRSSNRTKIIAWFSYMQLETCCDRVELYNSQGALLISISESVGYFRSPVYSSGSNFLSIRFVTNSVNTFRGFRMVYQTVVPSGNYEQRQAVPDPQPSPAASLPARSDIECATLCEAVQPAFEAARFDSERGICQLYVGGVVGFVRKSA